MLQLYNCCHSSQLLSSYGLVPFVYKWNQAKMNKSRVSKVGERLTQCFSTSALLTFWCQSFFVMGVCPLHGGMFSFVPAPTHWKLIALPHPSCDKQVCLQTLWNVPDWEPCLTGKGLLADFHGTEQSIHVVCYWWLTGWKNWPGEFNIFQPSFASFPFSTFLPTPFPLYLLESWKKFLDFIKTNLFLP